MEQSAIHKGSKLVKGAAVLGAAAILSKLLGTLQKIPMQNVAGDEAFGIYNAVYPLYILILFLATAGFPVAVSKFVSERAVVNDHLGARRVVMVSTVVLMGTGVLFFLLLFFGAGKIAEWIGVIQTERAIRSVSFALLVVPSLSVLRGYFQGYQNMMPTAVSQVVEQFIRVLTMMALLWACTSLHYGDDWVAAGATFGSVTGALAGLLIMLYYWVSLRRTQKERASSQALVKAEPIFKLVKQFAAYALPICLGSIVLPILTIVDTFTMPRLLQMQGLSSQEAMRQFGLYNHGLPLVQLVAMIASSMSAVLVPAIAEAKVTGQTDLIRRRTELTLRITWMIGLASTFGLAVAAGPINIMFFKSNEASWTMSIVAFTALFSTFNIVTSSVLQGFGAVRSPAVHLIIACAVKVAGNLFLMPRLGIVGSAISAVLAFAAAAVLNMAQVKRLTGASFTLSQYIYKPMLAVAVMSLCLAGLIYGGREVFTLLPLPVLSDRLANTVIALLGVIGGALVYVLALFRFGAMSRFDLQHFPSLEKRLAPAFMKFNILGDSKKGA